MSVRDDYESGAFQHTSSSGLPGQKSTGSIRDSYKFDQGAVNARLKKEQDDELKRQQQEQQRQQQAQRDRNAVSPKNAGQNAVDFIKGVNEKVLGGAVHAAVKSYNTITSGFNNDEANKKTDAFLKKAGQGAPAKPGAYRETDAFKTGQSAGDTIKTIVGVDAPKDVYNSAKNLVQQGRISASVKEKSADPSVVKNQLDYLNSELKKGTVTKDYVAKETARLQAKADTHTKSIKEAEQKTGAKYDPNSGVTDLLMTAANLEGLGAIGKSVFTSAAKAATKRLGRDLTEEEAKNLAAQTKKTVPEKAPDIPTSRQTEAGSISVAPMETGVKPVELPQPLPHENPAFDVPAAPVKPTVEAPKPMSIKQINGEADINDLATKANNSFRNNAGGVKEGGIERAKQEIENGTAKPIRIRTTDEGNVVIEDGRHRLQAAQELGMESFPVEDVSSSYGAVKKPVETVGDTTSGNASRIEAVALEKKLTDKMGDLPQYKSINMKEQAQEATNLISTNRQHAIDIIEGRANPPGNLKAQSVHQALEDLAIKEGDGALLTKLAKSHINTDLSESAQNLRIAAERDPHSAVEQIRQIRDARVKAAEKRSKTTVSKEARDIKKKVDAATPKATKQDWASFVKELTC